MRVEMEGAQHFNLIYTPWRVKKGDSERLDRGNRVPFSMGDLMQVLMRLPFGPAVQMTEPQGLEWEPRSRTLGWARKLSKQGHRLLTFGG